MSFAGPDSDDDLFAEPVDMAAEGDDGQPWKVLIADDDQGVHAATTFALSSFRFRNRPIELLSAFSGEEAIRQIEAHEDLALIFLDVVMETEDAGLRVARHVRQILERLAVRIVLRTGQPGQAPVRQVIVDYDINDYKEKTELTEDRLFVTTVAALRGYSDIRMIERLKDAAYQTLSLESALVSQLVETVTPALLVTDPLLSVTACNAAAADALAIDREAAVGRSLYEILPSDVLAAALTLAPGEEVRVPAFGQRLFLLRQMVDAHGGGTGIVLSLEASA